MRIGNYRIGVKSWSGLLIPAVMVVLISAYMFEAKELYSSDSMLLVRWTFFAFLVTLLIVLKEELLILKAGETESDSPSVIIGKKDTVKAIIFVALMLLYVFSMKSTGFILATLIFPTVIMYLLGTRKLATLILTPIILTLSIHVVFKVWLMVPLPAGPFGF